MSETKADRLGGSGGFDAAGETVEAELPLALDAVEPGTDVVECAELGPEQGLSAVAFGGGETHVGEQVEVFGDRLTGDAHLVGEPGGGRRAVGAESLEDRPPCGVTEDGEDVAHPRTSAWLCARTDTSEARHIQSTQAGAGVVWDSDPHRELLETEHKLRAGREAIATAGGGR